MSDEQQPPAPLEVKPLTAEEWIARLAYQASSDPTVQRVVRDHLLYLRHLYEADRQQLYARIAELEAQLASQYRPIDGKLNLPFGNVSLQLTATTIAGAPLPTGYAVCRQPEGGPP